MCCFLFIYGEQVLCTFIMDSAVSHSHNLRIMLVWFILSCGNCKNSFVVVNLPMFDRFECVNLIDQGQKGAVFTHVWHCLISLGQYKQSGLRLHSLAFDTCWKSYLHVHAQIHARWVCQTPLPCGGVSLGHRSRSVLQVGQSWFHLKLLYPKTVCIQLWIQTYRQVKVCGHIM